MLFRRSLSIVLSALMILPSPALLSSALAAPAGRNSEQVPARGGVPSNVDPSVEEFLQDLETGKIQQRSVQQADVFGLTGQRVEIFDRNGVRTYNLDATNVELPPVAFTALKIVYDRTNRELRFDGYRGVDREGNNGVLVARQTLTNIDLLASAEDAELFQFVDKEHRMHAIDRGFVALQVFKSSIPVFRDLWIPTGESKSHIEAMSDSRKWNVRAGFLTRGSNLDLSTAVIAPHDQAGEIKVTAGDFYVAYGENQGPQDKALGIFTRATTYEQIIRGYKVLQWQAAMLSPSTGAQARVEQLITELQNEYDRQDLEATSEKISPQARRVIGALNPDTLKGLAKRTAAVGELKKNPFDTFGRAEWLETYSEIKANIPSDGTIDDKKAEEAWFELITKVNSASIDEARAATKSPSENRPSRLKAIRKAVFSERSAIIVTAGLTAALLGLPYAYDSFETIQQIKVVSWTYESYFPAVLKDATYRTPLILSMVGLAALWPEAVGLSALIGKTLRTMADKVKTETTKKAVYLKDLAKNWSGLNNWQRINSFGLRLYGWLILPYWRVAIEYITQQKTFFSAVNNNLNPFQKLLADSEVGRQLGLTEDQRIGLNRISGLKFGVAAAAGAESEGVGFEEFGTNKFNVPIPVVRRDDRKAERIESNLRAQSALVENNRKLDSIAMLVAATLVSEKHGMDPASLLMIGSETGQDFDLRRISEVIDTPEKRQEWKLMVDLLIRQMGELRAGSVLVDNHMSELIERYFAAGNQIAERLKTLPELQQKLLRLRASFNAKLNSTVKAFANFAVEDHNFLKNIYTNNFVSEQVKKEFTIDHLMVVGIYGLYGERANLARPEHLSADPEGFLWTSRAHWYDMFLNTFAHFFIAGAQMALVFQKVKPKVAANYAPIEDYRYVSRDRVQGIWSATRDWMEVFNLEKSDLGGIIWKRFTKRFTTLTAGLTMMMVLRVLVWKQALPVAMAAWSFNFVAAQWFFGWVWDPVQRGNEMEGERLDEMNNRLKAARREISRGDFEKGRADLVALYERYNPYVAKVTDFDKLNRQETLLLSVDQPPVFTKSNPRLSWITTWGAAVGSTALAIPLSVILMDEKLLMASETWAFWVPVSVAAYAATFFLRAKYITAIKAKWAELSKNWYSFKGVDGPMDNYLRHTTGNKLGLRGCQGLFAP